MQASTRYHKPSRQSHWLAVVSTTRMNHPEEPPKLSASGRGLHRSTYVFLAFVVVVVLLLNLPGQHVLDVDFSDRRSGPHSYLFLHCEHGWPFTFLRREPRGLNGPRLWSPWNLTKGVEQFTLPALITNSVVGVAVAIVGGLLFEARRRRRKRLLQFDLRELLILVTVVSACAAALAVQRSQYRNEQDILRAIDETARQDIDQAEWDVAKRIEWRPGGPTWIRQLVGDQMFTVFDRVVAIHTTGAELKHVVELSHLKVVRIWGPVSNRQLKSLEQLPQLEALELLSAHLVDEGPVVVDADGNRVIQYISLPKLPNLRGLSFCATYSRGDGLENIPSIEFLDLTGTDIDDQSIPVLATLTELRRLTLEGTDVSESGIEQLRRALPECEIVDER